MIGVVVAPSMGPPGRRREVVVMGFLDKVKEQASVATAAAKEVAQKGQAKVDSIQAKRAADALLRDLGLAAYLEQEGRGTATTSADIERLIAALKAHEAANGDVPAIYESPTGLGHA
jgi:hypothetical protein